MPQQQIRYWQSMTTSEVTREVGRDPVVILPLAAIEQHGPHLPLSTDLDIGIGLLNRAFERLIDDFPVWALPALAVGVSDEHMHFPGTLSLSQETLGNVIHEHGAALSASGVRRLVLANSHGGNRAVLTAAGLKLRREHRMLVVKFNYFEIPPVDTAGISDSEWRHGLHGGAIETAMMMHLRPDLVRLHEIRNAEPLGAELERTLQRLTPEGATSFSWLAEDINRSGVSGDARQADAAKGERLVTHYADALAEAIRDAKAFPLERLA